MNRWMRAVVIAMGVAAAAAAAAHAYPVGRAVGLDKLAEQADIVFKGTALSSAPVEDARFKSVRGFHTRQTRFRVVSVIKGEAQGHALAFRHYDRDRPSGGFTYEPQWYRFEDGASYIVFAKRSETPGVFRQLWRSHTIKSDQGVLRCAHDGPVAADTVKEALWFELMALLASDSPEEVTYAIGQLDQMSGGPELLQPLKDFDRERVLDAVSPFIGSPDPEIAQAALVVIGSHNPYLSDQRALFWLATVGSGVTPGIGKMDPDMHNVGGRRYQKELVEVADSEAADPTRAVAVRALGLVRDPMLRKPIERWTADAAPGVRAAAALLLADFSGPQVRAHLSALAQDPAPRVRACAARAVGFGQKAPLADTLAPLLSDEAREVREAAAMSLLSFSPKNEAIARIFRANLDNDEFRPLFLLALAREHPANYLDALARTVVEKTEPQHWWGGQIPAFTAWEILFKYLQAQPAEEIRSGRFDRYLDAIEQVGNYSSSEPRDIYAFYLQRGMTERAQAFRRKAVAAASYDLGRYLDQVDENPSLYTRQ